MMNLWDLLVCWKRWAIGRFVAASDDDAGFEAWVGTWNWTPP